MALLAVLIAWCVRLLRGYRRRSTQRVAAAPANLRRSALVPGIFGYLRRPPLRSPLWPVLGPVLSPPVLSAPLELSNPTVTSAPNSLPFPLRLAPPSPLHTSF